MIIYENKFVHLAFFLKPKKFIKYSVKNEKKIEFLIW